MAGRGREKIYALYKGENLLGIGTAKELAEMRGVKVETIHYYKTPRYQKRGHGSSNRLCPVSLDD